MFNLKKQTNFNFSNANITHMEVDVNIANLVMKSIILMVQVLFADQVCFVLFVHNKIILFLILYILVCEEHTVCAPQEPRCPVCPTPPPSTLI